LKILSLGRDHISTLLLHLGIMRNSVKKSLHRNLGRKEGKEKLKVYDEVVDIIEKAHVEEKEVISLNDTQNEMLSSFLYWYLEAIKQQGEKEKIDYQNSVVYTSLNYIFSLLNPQEKAQYTQV
jgi:hypothetical protein